MSDELEPYRKLIRNLGDEAIAEELASRDETIATLQRLLAESQAREPYGWFIDAEHEDIFIRNDGSGFDIQPDWVPLFTMAHHSDSTALDTAIVKAKREVLLDAEQRINQMAGEDVFYSSAVMTVSDATKELRRMDDELKGGEQ